MNPKDMKKRTKAYALAIIRLVATLPNMELLVEAGILPPTAVAELCDEGNQIVSIVVSSINTARGGKR